MIGMMISSDEFIEGQDAVLQGMTDADCPYVVGSDEALDWMSGFLDEGFLNNG